MTTEVLETKFGTAKIGQNGYYKISSGKEGNGGKFLHRLIVEDFYNTTLPDDWVVHHDDGDRTNNEIWNLIPMPRSEHASMHNKGKEGIWKGKHLPKQMRENISKANKGKIVSEETRRKISEKNKGKKRSKEYIQKLRILTAGQNNGMYGKNHSEESKLKMSQARKGIFPNKEHRLKLSKIRSSSGFYSVIKKKDETCKQGFIWRYETRIENKIIRVNSVDLIKLKQKVLDKNLIWEMVDEEKAKATLESVGLSLDDIK